MRFQISRVFDAPSYGTSLKEKNTLKTAHQGVAGLNDAGGIVDDCHGNV
jgi:hypothetical protein